MMNELLTDKKFTFETPKNRKKAVKVLKSFKELSRILSGDSDYRPDESSGSSSGGSRNFTCN